jgi:hypothetical protein
MFAQQPAGQLAREMTLLLQLANSENTSKSEIENGSGGAFQSEDLIMSSTFSEWKEPKLLLRAGRP